MRLSEKFLVPDELALLYDFANSLDLRSYVEQGAAHVAGDELARLDQLEAWLRARDLLEPGVRLSAADHARALELREAIRGFVRLDPAERPRAEAVAARLDAAAVGYPLVVRAQGGRIELGPAPAADHSGLARVLAQLHLLSQTGRLDRLKMCASEECGWIFFDRSKPGNRRWCSSALCGNRHKTRDYRLRRQGG